MSVALFWSAGRVDWWAAWAALAVMAGWIAATAIIVFRVNPDLPAERLGPREGAKAWDTAIVSSLGLVQPVRYAQRVAGLDQRFGRTSGLPVAAQIGAPALLWSYPIGVPADGLLVPRTALEDRALRAEPAGYGD